jgi:hypothetical protein
MIFVENLFLYFHCMCILGPANTEKNERIRLGIKAFMGIGGAKIQSLLCGRSNHWRPGERRRN